MQSIGDLLGRLGLASGWRLTAATGISDDGEVIVGTGFNPSGFEEGWVAVFVPEPGAAIQAAVALATIAGLRRRKSASGR